MDAAIWAFMLRYWSVIGAGQNENSYLQNILKFPTPIHWTIKTDPGSGNFSNELGKLLLTSSFPVCLQRVIYRVLSGSVHRMSKLQVLVINFLSAYLWNSEGVLQMLPVYLKFYFTV